MRLRLNPNNMLTTCSRVTAAVATAFLTTFCEVAEAGRRFTYVYEAKVAEKGEIEVENWVTWKSGPGDKNGFDFRHELEYGVTDRLQMALYPADWKIADGVASYQTTALESIYQLTDPKKAFLGSALYGEVKLGNTQFKLEAKGILQKNIGPLVLAYNTTFEPEWKGSDLGNLNTSYCKLEQSAGASWKFTDNIKVGGEFLQRFYLTDWSVPTQSVVYAGPNVALEYGHYFATFTAMVQATGVSGQPDFQLRTIFGVEF